MHGAWTIGLYFHFRSTIWRHHRVPRPRFPIRRLNFCDSRTFKADILLLNICMGFQDLLTKNGGFGGQNRGRGGAILTPNELVLTFRGSYVCANFGENRSRNATVRALADGQTHRQTDRQTDANRFYNLSHAICYSYGTDKNVAKRPLLDCLRSTHPLHAGGNHWKI